MDRPDNCVLETTGFVSKSCSSRGRTGVSAALKTGAHVKKRSRRGQESAYFLIRLGICAAIFCSVLAVKLTGDEKTLAVIADAAFGGETERDDDDSLGRLKFVELPSMIDVFAPSKTAVVPAEASVYTVEDDGRELVLLPEAGTSVVCPVDGSVINTGFDEELGCYVSVAGRDDISFTLYGLENVCVERGQPLKQRQKLGEAGEKLTVRAYVSGRPVEPASLFGIGEKL